MRLEELNVYKLAMNLGEQVWSIVEEWNIFQKDTIGKQLVRSVDSIAANLSEGYGRYHFKESKNFSYYSRGSLFETKTWLTKAYNRKLIEDSVFEQFMKDIDVMGIKLNNDINSIGNTYTNDNHSNNQ